MLKYPQTLLLPLMMFADYFLTVIGALDHCHIFAQRLCPLLIAETMKGLRHMRSLYSDSSTPYLAPKSEETAAVCRYRGHVRMDDDRPASIRHLLKPGDELGLGQPLAPARGVNRDVAKRAKIVLKPVQRGQQRIEFFFAQRRQLNCVSPWVGRDFDPATHIVHGDTAG